MVSDPGLQWVLTAVFGATGLYAVLRMVTDRTPLVMVGQGLHLLMSAGMIAMCWPWWPFIPALPQVALFGAAGAWFAALFGLQLTHRLRRAALGGHGPWQQAAHLIMMLAMVWMTVSMHPGEPTTLVAHRHDALPMWASLSGVALTGALLVAGAIFVVELVICLRGRTIWLGHTGDIAAGGAMSLGMAAMCWPMITG